MMVDFSQENWPKIDLPLPYYISSYNKTLSQGLKL